MDLSSNIDSLLMKFPEFKNSEYFLESDDKKSAYTVFHDFTRFLIDRIDKSSDGKDQVIKKAFELINEMLNSDDFERANLAGVGVLEYLVESPKAVSMAKQSLVGNAQTVLKDILAEI